MSIAKPAALRAAVACFTILWSAVTLRAQDNFLVYGNSILFAPAVDFFKDLVTQTGAPTPNVVTYIGSNKTTSDYVAQIGLINSGIGAGQAWRAVIVEGGTVEITPNLGDPAAFHANMLTLAAAFFTHSPNGLFVGHETGADHPNSSNYPLVAPDPETWLGYSQAAYSAAAAAITAAHPLNPRARLANQGTCWAATAGYPTYLYQSDLHHLSPQGKLLCAMLWYVEVYGGRIEDIAVDYSVATPLVTRLLANNIDVDKYLRLVGLADRSQPPTARPFPGSDGDFQLRAAVDSTVVNLTTFKTGHDNSTLRVRPFSPLGATQDAPAAVLGQVVPTGHVPNGGTPPELWLDPSQMQILLMVPDLNGGSTDLTIPPGLNGFTMWVQAVSRGPVGGSTTYSDAQLVIIR